MKRRISIRAEVDVWDTDIDALLAEVQRLMDRRTAHVHHVSYVTRRIQ